MLLFLFFFLSPSQAQNISDMIAQNPLLAEMAMFSQLSENSTISVPTEDDGQDLLESLTTKRSIIRDTVSDNFDARYYQMNASLFDEADLEFQDIDYRETATLPDDVALQQAIEVEEVTSSTTSTSPFAASSSLFETPMVTSSFARTSPYFKAFPSTSTSTFVASSFSTMPPDDVVASEFPETPSITASGTTDEEMKFFVDPEEDVDDTDVQDISMTSEDSDDVTTARGLQTASFQGASWPQLAPLPFREEEGEVQRKRDEDEVVQYNGKYSVSATKYYIDNRVDGEFFQSPVPEMIEDSIEENTVQDTDPFAVEREMRKNVKMHAAKTQVLEDPIAGLEMLMSKGAERRLGDEIVPENEKISLKTDGFGRNYEARETTYKGEKTTVNLWNANLHGHDLIRFPGAIFDDRIDEPRRKSDKRRAVASRIILSSDEIPSKTSRFRKVIAGVTTSSKHRKIEDRERKITEDVESVCFNSKKNTVIAKISPFDSEDDLTKLECLTRCAKTKNCSAATYSVPLSTCAMYSDSLELHRSAVRSQGHSLHRKLSRTTSRCVRMFFSKEFFDSEGPEDVDDEAPPTFLRLVEKDGNERTRAPLFAQQPRCQDGQDVIFVRSDDVEAANHQERRNYVAISEDDCVFACLTNSRPGGGTSDCTAIEYDKTRGFCYLMTSPPGDATMTPRPLRPVTTYEKICIQQKSANKCSGGQPVRYRQKVLIGHLVDAHSVSNAAECIDLCIEKHTIGCVSVMFYAKETTLNCILNDSNNQDDPASFFVETSTIVDFFTIQECLGIKEINRRNKKRKLQNRAEQRARLRRKMARM